MVVVAVRILLSSFVQAFLHLLLNGETGERKRQQFVMIERCLPLDGVCEMFMKPA